MKIKLRDLLMVGDKLLKLSKISLPPKLSYTVAKNIKNVRKELKLLENKQIEIATKYGAIETDDGYEIVKPSNDLDPVQQNIEIEKYSENVKNYRKEEREILDKEIDIDLWIIKLSSFTDDIRIPADVLIGLDFILEDN